MFSPLFLPADKAVTAQNWNQTWRWGWSSQKAPLMMPKRADFKIWWFVVWRVLLTDACVLCWRGPCSSQFPPGQAGPPCPASWGFWAASSWPADTSAETCWNHSSDGISATDPITLLIDSFLMHLNAHQQPNDFPFLYELLMTHEAASHSCRIKSITKDAKYQNTPTYGVVLSCSSKSFRSRLNEISVNVSVHRKDEWKFQKGTCNFLSGVKEIHLMDDNDYRQFGEKEVSVSECSTVSGFSIKSVSSSTCFTSSKR